MSELSTVNEPTQAEAARAEPIASFGPVSAATQLARQKAAAKKAEAPGVGKFDHIFADSEPRDLAPSADMAPASAPAEAPERALAPAPAQHDRRGAWGLARTNPAYDVHPDTVRTGIDRGRQTLTLTLHCETELA